MVRSSRSAAIIDVIVTRAVSAIAELLVINAHCLWIGLSFSGSSIYFPFLPRGPRPDERSKYCFWSRMFVGLQDYEKTVNLLMVIVIPCKLVQWPLMGRLLYLVQWEGGWTGPQSAQSLIAVPNVIVHPSTASVPITVLLCKGETLCIALLNVTPQNGVDNARSPIMNGHG